MMSFKSCWRVQVPFLTMTQSVLFSSWNKHFTVNFKQETWLQSNAKSRVIGNAEDVFMSWLPCCTRASAFWVTTVCKDSLSGTSPPARRSTPVTIKVQSAELVWRSCTTDQMHENAENIPSTWLRLKLGRELFSSANLLTTEKLRTSVYCQTNTLCTTYLLSPYRFWHILCIRNDFFEQHNLVWMMCRYGGRFHDDERSSDQCETLKDEGLHGCEQVVSRFSGLLECVAPNIASFLLGLEHITLQTSEEEPHQIRTVSMSYHMFHPVQNLGF